ncbi:unnamed protein product, partial [Tilletia laevis]
MGSKKDKGKPPAPWQWTREQEEAICEWLAKPSRDGTANGGARSYDKSKATACEHMLEALHADKPIKATGLTSQQLVNKVAKMISLYKKILDTVENSTGGGVAREHHDTADWIWDKHGGRGAKQSKKKESIKAYISRICHYYYTMDDILGDKANVKPPSLLEGGVRTQLQLANLATSKRKSAAKKDNGEDEEEDEDEEEEEEEEEEKEDEEEEDEE